MDVADVDPVPSEHGRNAHSTCASGGGEQLLDDLTRSWSRGARIRTPIDSTWETTPRLSTGSAPSWSSWTLIPKQACKILFAASRSFLYPSGRADGQERPSYGPIRASGPAG